MRNLSGIRRDVEQVKQAAMTGRQEIERRREKLIAMFEERYRRKYCDARRRYEIGPEEFRAVADYLSRQLQSGGITREDLEPACLLARGGPKSREECSAEYDMEAAALAEIERDLGPS